MTHPPMARRRKVGPLTVAVVLLLAAATLTSCSRDDDIRSSSKCSSMTPIKMGFSPIFERMPVIFAKEAGYFAAECLAVSFVQTTSGGTQTPALLSGAIDVEATTTDRAVLLAEKKQSTVNLISFMNRNQLKVLARSDVTARDIPSLRGKRIGVTSPGSGTDLSMRYFLKQAGLDPDRDVTMVYTGSSMNMIAALEKKQVDAVNASQPVIHQTTKPGGTAKVLLDVAKNGPGEFRRMPFLSLGAAKTWVDEHPDLAEAVIRAQHKANQDLRKDPTRALRHVDEYFPGTQESVALEILRAQSPYYISAITQDEVAAANRVNRSLGLLTRTISYDEVTVPASMRKVWES